MLLTGFILANHLLKCRLPVLPADLFDPLVLEGVGGVVLLPGQVLPLDHVLEIKLLRVSQQLHDLLLLLDLLIVEVTQLGLLLPLYLLQETVIFAQGFGVGDDLHIPEVHLGRETFYLELAVHVVDIVVLATYVLDVVEWLLSRHQLSILKCSQVTRMHAQEAVGFILFGLSFEEAKRWKHIDSTSYFQTRAPWFLVLIALIGCFEWGLVFVQNFILKLGGWRLGFSLFLQEFDWLPSEFHDRCFFVHGGGDKRDLRGILDLNRPEHVRFGQSLVLVDEFLVLQSVLDGQNGAIHK